ncbi:hypothetical protein GCM10008107_12540 [Psychrosphaera saromensis]|uniref:Uncharacterized protein n=1 Tax=Psychrosphaera saromensis TaxID=716813 RepID=A0A2S7UU33_9GAMM|nr:hypothetical protein [Psychrosphaera saromensis]PQJ53494.1 hypothetical protein BTO11_07320 [Psychrosphaera saromensis]GHB65022.1 hypothetical protein GCM10008107_12540 [Psychrosphaera saromensis]GLQ14710.1 hypothetical protein GCM10007917_21650 [Psychrosphaera saromensis]
MRKLLASPVKMALSDAENTIYQSILQYATELSLNLMAVKVVDHPENFLNWSTELLRITNEDLNQDLMDPPQFVPLKKMQDLLEKAISLAKLKMVKISPWVIYSDFIQAQSTVQALDERFRLLDHIDSIRSTPLAQMTELDLLAFAGKHTNQHDFNIYDFDCEWFGSTKGAKVFHAILQTKAHELDKALAHIPLEGEVTHDHYQAFVTAYTELFTTYTENKPAGEKAGVAPASRLLAMRRPDQFVALTNAKVDVVCQGLSITKFNNFSFDGYWNELVTAVRSFAWWRKTQPEDEMEQKIWRNRAILMDLYLFAGPELAGQSNYVRLRDKPISTRKASGATRTKRTKETAEMIVDKRLASDDMPAYMQNKRNALISEVKLGKNIDQVITLMRKIFG